MPKVTIKRDGFEVEADLTLDEIKNLFSNNGHKASAPAPEAPQPRSTPAPLVTPIRGKATQKPAPDFAGFWKSISERAQSFLRIMRDNPKGIDGRDLAPLLGFTNPSQLGGLTGPGMTKIGQRFGIKSADLYRSEIVFPNGDRKRMFYPGKLTLAMTDDETPLFARG
jgi:hypothetical protein